MHMQNIMLIYDEKPFSIHRFSDPNLFNNLKQVKLDMVYLTMAKVWSTMSHSKRAQVGALLVKDGTIISDGFNGTPTGLDNCCEDSDGNTHWYVLHAETNVITKLSKNAVSGENSTLYVTMSPCRDCSKLILQSDIKRVVFLTPYRILDGLEFLIHSNLEVSYYADLNPLIEFDFNKISVTGIESKEQFIEIIKQNIKTV